jgi:hypothetical protein
MKRVSIDDVRRRSRGHWFNSDTLKFFSCRLPDMAYQVGKCSWFVSSEKPKGGKRRYAIRMMNAFGDVLTIDKGFVSEASAERRMLKLIKMRLPQRVYLAYQSVSLTIQRGNLLDALNELGNRKIKASLPGGEVVLHLGKRQLKWSDL